MRVTVIPDAKHHYHAPFKRFGDLSHSPFTLEGILLSESLLLCSAKFRRQRISLNCGYFGMRVLDNCTVLDIEAFYLEVFTAADELCDDSKFPTRIHNFSFAIEILVTHTIWVEVASIRIAHTTVSVLGRC